MPDYAKATNNNKTINPNYIQSQGYLLPQMSHINISRGNKGASSEQSQQLDSSMIIQQHLESLSKPTKKTSSITKS